MKTPRKIFTTWNPIAGTNQIKDDEDERVGNNSVAIKSISIDGGVFKRKRKILTWI